MFFHYYYFIRYTFINMFVCMHVSGQERVGCLCISCLFNSEYGQLFWCGACLGPTKIKIITISIVTKAAVACAAHMQSLAREPFAKVSRLELWIFTSLQWYCHIYLVTPCKQPLLETPIKPMAKLNYTSDLSIQTHIHTCATVYENTWGL